MMAAGESARFSHSSFHRIKKQWLRIGDEPLWSVATSKLSSYFNFEQIFITSSAQDFAYMSELSPYPVIQGGATRCQSLKNALKHIKTPLVLVSDVARWNTDQNVIQAMFETLNDDISCVVPYLTLNDTCFYQDDYLKREDVKCIQTPQLSRTEDLRKALESLQDFSDESSAFHYLGKKIAFVSGSYKMNKITYAQDILLHLDSMTPPSQKLFIGSGIDIHEFEQDKQMVLGGVNIKSHFGFKAHSDGDVLLHALSDAILGAIGGGDIGQWFPDTDSKYKNADSKIMLQQIYDFAQSVGFELVNADISILAQTPKLSPYKLKMRQAIAQILRVPIALVNIKATTTENLGFIGRKEGLCVQANVCMQFIDWHKNARNIFEYKEKL